MSHLDDGGTLTHALEHDPEKWIPVFGKGLPPRRRGSCSTNNVERDDESKISHPALATGGGLHVGKQRRGRPAIGLEPIGLLIGAQRRAREHAGLAVDLVFVDAELG